MCLKNCTVDIVFESWSFEVSKCAWFRILTETMKGLIYVCFFLFFFIKLERNGKNTKLRWDTFSDSIITLVKSGCHFILVQGILVQRLMRSVMEHNLMWHWCFFFHYYLATLTNWVQIFTGLVFCAYVEIHQVRRLAFDSCERVSSVFNNAKVFS